MQPHTVTGSLPYNRMQESEHVSGSAYLQCHELWQRATYSGQRLPPHTSLPTRASPSLATPVSSCRWPPCRAPAKSGPHQADSFAHAPMPVHRYYVGHEVMLNLQQWQIHAAVLDLMEQCRPGWLASVQSGCSFQHIQSSLQ